MSPRPIPGQPALRRPAPRQLARARRRRLQLIVLPLSILAGLLLVEVAYRAALLVQLNRKVSHATFGVVNEPLYEFDKDLGYRYAAGKVISQCQITDNMVGGFHQIAVNRMGNLDPDAAGAPGRPRTLDPDAAGAPGRPRILVFGDSFTANPRQPYSWTNALAERTGFEVLNFARDGYGVLQMFHLAAVKTRELQPDLAIIAFIVDDLRRARTWRTSVESGGRQVMVVSTRPSPAADLDEAMELDLVDPAVTPEWYRSLPAGPAGKDPVVGRLNRTYRGIVLGRLGSHFLSLRRSFLVSKIARGDPYHGLHVPSRTPRIALRDYGRDPGMVRDIRSLQVPFLVVLLPTSKDLAKGQYVMGPPERALYQSLQKLQGQQIDDLMDYLAEMGGAGKRYWLPGDGHPSPAGSTAFAEAMAKLIEKRTGLKPLESRAPAPPGGS